MGLPKNPVTLTPTQMEELGRKLSQLRHNINNHLSLIVAAAELIKRKPEMGPKMMDSLVDQPQKIVDEVRKFSDEFNHALGISRD
jgi:hypothetical protein